MKPSRQPRDSAIRDLPRKPVRANGVERYESLLDAMERLLEFSEPDQISLADIAAEAGASTASAYHFFPTMAAAHAGFVERIAERCARMLEAEDDASTFATWSELVVDRATRARLYYNAQKAGRKIVFGPTQSSSVHYTEMRMIRVFARDLLNLICQNFEIDEKPHLQQVFEIALHIHDAVWSMSVAEHQTITDEMAREAQRALIAYLRGYLPEFAPRRSSPSA